MRWRDEIPEVKALNTDQTFSSPSWNPFAAKLENQARELRAFFVYNSKLLLSKTLNE